MKLQFRFHYHHQSKIKDFPQTFNFFKPVYPFDGHYVVGAGVVILRHEFACGLVRVRSFR